MIRFGVIGTNWITDKFLEAAKELEDFCLTAVYSRSEVTAREFANAHGASYTFTDIEEMAQSDTIDAVYIASPNSLHASQAILCMNNGKHVLCEKPFASNKSEAEAMMAAARKNNVLFMEAMKSTCTPCFLAVKEHLAEIGPVRRYFANFCQYSSRYDEYKKGNILNAFNPTFSNGALMDIGVYTIAPLVHLFGEPQSIKAMGTILESGVDGQGSVIMQYEQHEAVVMYSKITDSNLPNEIQGEAGSIIIDKISSPSHIQINYRNGEQKDISVPQKENTMYYEAKEFISLIKNNQTESSINTFARSMSVIKIMDEVRRQLGITYPADQV